MYRLLRRCRLPYLNIFQSSFHLFYAVLLLQEFLNPWEMTLVQQINQAQAPVHIEVQERPTAAAGPDVTAELVST